MEDGSVHYSVSDRNRVRSSTTGCEMQTDNSRIDYHKRGITIGPASTSIWSELAALWDYRELLLFLTLRDIKIRYSNTVIGLAWVVLKPLSTVVIFSLLFGRMVKIESEGIPYPVFAFAGVVPWFFFSNTVNSCSNSLIGSSNLITKVYFPRLIIPAAALIAGLTDFLVSLLLMSCLIFYFGIRLNASIIFLPYLVFITALLTLGVGIFTSALSVRYRDVQHVLPFLLQLMMFVTPVIYPSSLLPPLWAGLVKLNPLTGVINGYRSIMFGRPLPMSSLLLSTCLTCLVVFFSTWYFRRTEDTFADII